MDGDWCCGHHERLREVGKKGGWIIMKRQAPQDAIQSICVLGSGGKIFKWWGLASTQGEVIMMYDGWKRVGGLKRKVSKLVAIIGR
jgi:hypothetical protein